MREDFLLHIERSELTDTEKEYLMFLLEDGEEEKTGSEILHKVQPLIRKIYRKPEYRQYRKWIDTTVDESSNCIYFCKLQEGIDDNNPGESNQWFYQLRHAIVVETLKYLKQDLDESGLTLDVGDDDSAIYLIPKDTPQSKKILGSVFYKKKLNQ